MSWGFEEDDPKNAYFFSGIFSCWLSLMVVLTYLLFPRLQGKLFMKIITFISFCDFVANVTVIRGDPHNHVSCYIQGLLQQFFYIASWMWTVIITYLLYSLVTKGKITLPEWGMHLISWGVALLCTVLPLTTSTYGAQANDDDWCWIQPRFLNHESIELSEFWIFLTFDCIIFGSFFLMTLWGILIFHHVRIQQIPTSKTVSSALQALLMYPIVLFITWFPNAIFLTAGIEQSSGQEVMLAVNSLSIWQGGLTAIVFFYNSKESRTHWFNVFKVCFGTCFPAKLVINDNERETMAMGGGGNEYDVESRPTFFDRIRQIDTHHNNNHVRPSTVETVDEDFESDDAYYGRDTMAVTNTNTTTTTPVETNIAMTEFKNPILNAH